MSGTLLAYGDKVIGVVARDNGSVSITADGVKTYSQLLDQLFALIDFNKISDKSCLMDSTDNYSIAHIGLKTSNRADFVADITNHRYAYSVRNSGSMFNYYTYTTSTYTNASNNVPSASTVFKIIY